MAGFVARGEYAITETDEALMHQAPPGRKGGTPRPDGITAAVQLLGQVGVRWSSAAIRRGP
jgi:hypothetical protein